MTSSALPKTETTGVTQQLGSPRRPSVSAAKPGAAAKAQRFLPPTVAEVGRAAALCFRDTDSDAQIAQQLGVVRRTLARWKQRADFAAAIVALQVWQDLTNEEPITATVPAVASRERQRTQEDISREGPG